MRSLPFDDGSFRLVVSSLAIHNIRDIRGRQQAIDEIWRVLEPGGHVLIADIHKCSEYAERLHALGAQDIVVRKLGWRFWYGGPHVATKLVSCRKAV